MLFITNIAAVLFSLLIAVALFSFFRSRDDTVAEASAYGLMLMLMVSSGIAQVLLVCGLQRFLLIGLLLPTIPAVITLIRLRELTVQQLKIARHFMKAHPLPAIVFVCGGLCMLAFTVWNEVTRGPISFIDIYSGLGHKNGSLFTLLHTGDQTAAIGLNHTIFLADWQPIVAAPLANCCAYLAIALATYALARRYAWPPTAITVTLLIVSMPRLVHQNLATQSELLPAAAALLVLLALFRTVERPQIEDGAILLSSISFSVTGGRLCYLFPAVLTALCLLVLARRHNLRLWIDVAKGHPIYIIVVLFIMLVFSQAMNISYNLLHGLPWIGALPRDEVVFNAGGILGAGANMVRYLLQTIHMPAFVDNVLQWTFGWRLVDTIESVYHQTVGVWAGSKDAVEAFELNWAPDNPWTWFGPVGFLMIVPAMVHALRLGPHRLKTTALAMLTYWSLIALIVAWQPSNVRLMTPLFVCSGFFTAFLLPPWRIGRTGCRVLQWICLAMIVYALLTYPGHSAL